MSSARVIRAGLLVVALGSVACREGAGREAFTGEWRRAVLDRDGQAAWGLIDLASRRRIMEGIERSQGRAAGDAEWGEIFVWVNRPVDVTRPAEELAVRLIGVRLGRGIDLADDGSDRIHREGGRWVAAVDPVGFTAADGTPLTLTALWLRAPAPPPPAPPAPRTPAAPVVIKVPWEGHTVDEIDAAYAAEAGTIAAARGLGDAYAADATRIMQIYSFHGTGQRAGVTEFTVDGDGGITPTVYVWSGAARRAIPDPQPKLDFRAWPGHN